MNTDEHRLTKEMVAAIAVLILMTERASAQPCGGYEVTAIIQAPKCPPFGYPPILPSGLNDLGWVVGHVISCVIGPDVAFLWTPEVGVEILEMPSGASQSRAIDINNHPDRQIVGTVDISDVGTRAFLIDGEELTIIPPPKGGTFSSVAALNNKRQVIGSTADGTPYSKAYIWEDGVMTIIEPTFGPRSAGRAIDEAGVVVGWMGTSFGIDSHAFVWHDPVLTDLGLAPNTFATWARGVNNLDEVLVRGEFDDDEPTNRINGSFLLRDGKFIDLGQLPGYDVIDGTDLNDQSQIVGLARAVESSDEPDVGFIWQGGIMTNLNDLIPPESQLRIQRAEGINSTGQIAAVGDDEAGDVVALLLTPVRGPLGDLDGDCQVGATDLVLLLVDWGRCDNCENCPADLDNNCVVGASDLLTLLVNWG